MFGISFEDIFFNPEVYYLLAAILIKRQNGIKLYRNMASVMRDKSLIIGFPYSVSFFYVIICNNPFHFFRLLNDFLIACTKVFSWILEKMDTVVKLNFSAYINIVTTKAWMHM